MYNFYYAVTNIHGNLLMVAPDWHQEFIITLTHYHNQGKSSSDILTQRSQAKVVAANNKQLCSQDHPDHLFLFDYVALYRLFVHHTRSTLLPTSESSDRTISISCTTGTNC